MNNYFRGVEGFWDVPGTIVPVRAFEHAGKRLAYSVPSGSDLFAFIFGQALAKRLLEWDGVGMTKENISAGGRTQFDANAPIKVDSVKIKWIPDEYPDLSWLEQDRYEGCDPKEAAEYLKQDRERLADYGSTWESLGCVVEAEVSRPIGQGSRRLETLSSSGLWGIESDSDRAYLRSVEDEQLEDLAEHLGAFGIEISAQQLRELA